VHLDLLMLFQEIIPPAVRQAKAAVVRTRDGSIQVAAKHGLHRFFHGRLRIANGSVSRVVESTGWECWKNKLHAPQPGVGSNSSKTKRGGRRQRSNAMNTPISFLATASVFVIAAFAAQVSSAQPTAGLSITNPVTDPANALWDFTTVPKLRHVNVDFKNNNTDVTMAFDDVYTQDGMGKLASPPGATNLVTYSVGGSGEGTFPGQYSIKGSITSAQGVARVSLSFNLTGVAFVGGLFRNVSVAASYTVTLDNVTTHQVTGRGTEKISASGLKPGAASGPLTPTPIPSELGDGSWTLVLDFGTTPASNKPQGTARVTLETGQVYPFNFTGTSTPQKGSLLNLKGVPGSAADGSIMQVTLDQNNAVSKIVGRVSGQTVNLKR
jgi:hypothetical protein